MLTHTMNGEMSFAAIAMPTTSELSLNKLAFPQGIAGEYRAIGEGANNQQERTCMWLHQLECVVKSTCRVVNVTNAARGMH